MLQPRRDGHNPGVERPPKLDHVVIKVSDLERSNAFYRDVVGAELVELPRGRHAYRVGDVQLNVHGPGSSPGVLPVNPVEPGNSDLCLEWPGPIDAAVQHLERNGVAILDGPVERQGARGTGHSVYFARAGAPAVPAISLVLPALEPETDGRELRRGRGSLGG